MTTIEILKCSSPSQHSKTPPIVASGIYQGHFGLGGTLLFLAYILQSVINGPQLPLILFRNFDGEGNLDEDGQQDVLPWEVICFSAFKKRCIRSHPKKSIYCALRVKNPISQLVPRQSFWRIFAMSIDLEEEPALLSKGDNLSDNDEVNRNDSSEKFVSQHLDSHELKSLLADSERSKLVKKLSEANQYNRFLKRQLQFNEDTLINFKSELAVLELELQTSVGLAEEVAKSGTYQGSRKINGKYVPSYLLSRLEAIHRRLKEQIKGIDAVKVRDVEFFWYGMAEIVQVMGSFDGWSHGEHMSPEYQGGFTKFSTVLKLRPGRYEIKFLVDGEWHLSPELPIIGEGLMQNNLLIVE
ncbi:hypothetical protein AAC387_Pa05g1352 [Persea americana]